MHLARLHPCCRNSPLGSVKVELIPLCGAQLSRTNEDHWGHAQDTHRGEVALIAVQRTKQLGYAIRLCDARKVGLL